MWSFRLNEWILVVFEPCSPGAGLILFPLSPREGRISSLLSALPDQFSNSFLWSLYLNFLRSTVSFLAMLYLGHNYVKTAFHQRSCVRKPMKHFPQNMQSNRQQKGWWPRWTLSSLIFTHPGSQLQAPKLHFCSSQAKNWRPHQEETIACKSAAKCSPFLLCTFYHLKSIPSFTHYFCCWRQTQRVHFGYLWAGYLPLFSHSSRNLGLPLLSFQLLHC